MKERIEELKKENDKINQRLQEILLEREELIKKAIENNGRILELERISQEKKE